jgi:hypothetical protein
MNGIDLLGATLLHFLWQGVLIAAVYATARRCSSRPEVRYGLACAAFGILALAPVLTWLILQPISLPVASASGSLHTSHVASAGSVFGGDVLRFFGAEYRPVRLPWLVWVVAAWVAGVVIFWLRLLGGWRMAQRLRRRHVKPVSRQWEQTFDGSGRSSASQGPCGCLFPVSCKRRRSWGCCGPWSLYRWAR